ncbi:MAG: ankyrin repeat domain-containing protein [Gammaproteobacteria bacterium]|nr:ankyrin repeat domain-containing protein [Gammaproteobacteria bacterium]
MLQNGANTHRGGVLDSGEKQLEWTLANGRFKSAALLLEAGANPTICLSNGISRLWIACNNGHVSVVDRFLKHPAIADFIHLPHQSKQTALEVATQRGKREIVQLLSGALEALRPGPTVAQADSMVVEPLVFLGPALRRLPEDSVDEMDYQLGRWSLE